MGLPFGIFFHWMICSIMSSVDAFWDVFDNIWWVVAEKQKKKENITKKKKKKITNY